MENTSGIWDDIGDTRCREEPCDSRLYRGGLIMLPRSVIRSGDEKVSCGGLEHPISLEHF